MIANYGYQDGSGEYFISIDTDCCLECAARWCVAACPQGMFAVERDDYDGEVALIVAPARRRLKELCSGCKPAGGCAAPPCTTACTPGALAHSW